MIPGPGLIEVLRALSPVLNEGTYVFTSLPLDRDLAPLNPLATFREREGLTVVVEEALARQQGLPILFRAAWITLMVRSDLQAVGLTAAVATALAGAGISCNVMAGAIHDHLFVPVERAEQALAVLRDLQRHAGG